MIPANPSPTTRRRYVANILATYAAASSEQRAKGASWYRTAHDMANIIGDGNVRMGAGVIAALSANKSWRLNVRLANDAAAGNIHGHTKANLAKVSAIMIDGADPEDVLPMSSKTGHFFRCIADPTDPDPVVIDRHAHDVAVGRTLGDAERGLSSVGRYAALAHAYRTAAARLGILPSELQAITWVVQTERIAGTSTRGHGLQNVD